MNDTPHEYDECKLFAIYLRSNGFLFSHVPNSTFTPSFGAMARNKALGVNSGVPDYIIITPKGLLFVEMKRQKGGQVSASQKEWIAALNELPGVQAEVCYGFEDAVRFIERIMSA